MKKGSTLFLQIVTVLIGIGVLIFMLLEPHLEGVNKYATTFEIYFKDPFLAYVYLTSIPFFIALYQTIKVLGYVRADKIFSQAAIKSLRIIKYSAFFTACAIVGAEAFIMSARSASDDPAGALMLGLVTTVASIIIGTVVSLFEHILENVVQTKSEK
jgi:hypothetical protein